MIKYYIGRSFFAEGQKKWWFVDSFDQTGKATLNKGSPGVWYENIDSAKAARDFLNQLTNKGFEVVTLEYSVVD